MYKYIIALILLFPALTLEARTSKKSAVPSSAAEAKKRQADTQKEIKQTEEQIKENELKIKKGLAELGKLGEEMKVTNNKISELNGKITQLNGEISGLETSISENEKSLEKLRSEYLKAVKKMRVTRKNKSTLAFIFSSGSFSQAMRRMRYLREFSAWRNRQTEEITEKTNQLKFQREELARAKEEQSKVLAQQTISRNKLAGQQLQQEKLVSDLRQNGSALQSHLKRKQAEAKELGSLVSRLIAREQQKAAEEARRKAEEEEKKRKLEEEKRLKQEETLAQETKEAKETKETKETNTSYANARKRAPRSKNERSTKENTENNKEKNSKPKGINGNSFQDMMGKLPYPTSGSFTITSRFGRQYLPDLPDVEYDNPGVDADTEAGATARVVYKGKVSGVYLLPGYHTVVIVNHGNYYTVYGNIASPAVKNGDNVDMGSSLGTLAVKDEDPSHSSIHFEVWKNREKLNPQAWLR